MVEIVTSATFDRWLLGLRDPLGKARVLARVERLAGGFFGDVGPVGQVISELRIPFGPGYRVYFMQRSQTLFLVFGGRGHVEPGPRYRAGQSDCEGLEGRVMVETFSRFDAANYLKSDEDVALYLESVNEFDDPAQMVVALNTVARARNMSQVARDAEMTREGLYKALSPEGNPSFATVSKIAKALGFRVMLRPL